LRPDDPWALEKFSKVVMAGFNPAIHIFLVASLKSVDARDIGERKRRRSSNGYARA
jgi:hypothetical protein